MTLPTHSPDQATRLRNALDWGVFTLGALSLVVAIAGTVAYKTDLLRAAAPSDGPAVTAIL